MTHLRFMVSAMWRCSFLSAVALHAVVCACQAGEPRIERGVVFGEAGGEPILLDVYQPSDDGPKDTQRAAVLLVHGGGWEGGNRSVASMVEIAKALAQEGYVAFSIDYRLVKDAADGKGVVNAYPAAIDDCRLAVQWIRRHAAKYRIDAVKLGACGESAGGHLVSLLGTTDSLDASDSEPADSSRVQAVVDIFGPADLTQDFSKFRLFGRTVQDLVDRFVGKGNVAAQREASPILHIDDQSAAFLIVHGTEDPLVPISQSREFDAALHKAGRKSELVEFAGDGHGFKQENRRILLAKIVAFFDRELKAVRKKPADQAKATTKAAEPDWGAIFRMHYQNRVKMFAEQNLVFKNVVLVGDSITEGFDVATYFPGRRIINRGIGADVIGNDLPPDDPRGVLKRLEQSIFDCAPTDVFLMIGINDLNSGRTLEVLEKGYRELFKQIKAGAPRVRVHVQSILPTRGGHAARNPEVLDANDRLKKLAAEFGYDYVDLHSQMVDAKGELKSEFTEDGLHLTPAAYAVWQAEVLRILDETRPTAPPK